MKRLSASLILLASCASAFAACSSSDDSSSSGGSAGIGGATAGRGGTSAGAGGHAGSSSNTGGTRANGAAGEAGESAGGEPNGAAGADTTGGSAGESSTAGSGGANGGSTNGGNTNGGSAGTSNSGGTSGASAGSGGTSGGSAGTTSSSGSGGISGTPSACGSSAKTTYASGLAAYFSAHVAASGCLGPQAHGADATQTQECASNGCGANAGCSASFAWHDASFDSATGVLTVQVDVASTLAVTGAATCSLTDGVSSKLITIGLTMLDDDTSLDTSLSRISASGGTPAAAGCETLANVSDIAADDLSQLVTQAEDAAITAALSYSVACTQ